MKKQITKKEFDVAESNMNKILAIASKKGGFDRLSAAENKALAKYSGIVAAYETEHYIMPMPQTIEGIIALKMYEKKLKQKDLARLLAITDTKLSEILNHKRKPSLSFLKAMNEKLGIDGNLLLRAS
ncbi:MAG TPA: helix-turn-helix domain-containing protein [Hanamia sp.]|nr:helix-turn-helix domain-containing protein [Hanamia sp.]